MLRSLLMFAWLAIGYAVLHMLLAMWGLLIVSAAVSGVRSGESLQFTTTGEPLIASLQGGRYASYRRLDGTTLTLDAVRELKLANAKAWLQEVPLSSWSWDRRIAPFQDFATPPGNWYLVAPSDRSRTAYFAGYDELSRRPVGFIGVDGFSMQPLAGSEEFRLAPTQPFAFQGLATSPQRPAMNREIVEPHVYANYYSQSVPKNTKSDLVWLLSEGTIYEVHLRERTVRAVVKDRPQIRHLMGSLVQRDDDSLFQLLARTDSGLLLIDPNTYEMETVSLGPIPAHATEMFYQLADGSWIVVQSRSTRDSKSVNDVLWTGTVGEVDRQEQIVLDSMGGFPQERAFYGMPPFAFPAPVASLATSLIVPIVSPPAPGGPATYLGRCAETFAQFHVWIAATLFIGLATGWAVRRREVDVFHNPGWLWPILVGVCGWFGWMGYICLRPLPAKLPHGQWLPEKPEPNRPLGIEIFA